MRHFDMHGSGNFVNEEAGENLGLHKLVYRNAAGTWGLADADLAATMPVIGITMGAMSTGRRGEILTEGYIGDSTWTWVSGDDLYASTVAGELTNIAPVAPDVVQVVAVAVTPTLIFFHAGLGGSGATGDCAILEGHTAYVGFNSCKETHTNYWFCDGVADDVQINAAITYVTSVGGGSIFLEAGTYQITTSIILDNKIQLIGTGFPRDLADGGATTLFLVNNSDVDVISGTNMNGILLRNFKIDGNRNNQSLGDGVSLSGCSAVNIENVWIDAAKDAGLSCISSTIEIFVESSYITNCGANHVDLIGSSDILLSQLLLGGGIGHGLNVEDSGNVQIIDCVAFLCGSDPSFNDGFHVFNGRSILFSSCHSSTNAGNGYNFGGQNDSNRGRNVHFVNCIAEENNRNGFVNFDYPPLGAKIIGCASRNNSQEGIGTYHGIALFSLSEGIIKGNTIYDDQVTETQEKGILLTDSSDNIVSNNICQTNNSDGIYLSGDSDDNLITENQLITNGAYGINISAATCNNNVVKENKFNTNTTAAINDAGTDTAVHESFLPVIDPDGTLGTHPTLILTDGITVNVYNQFAAPLSYQQIVTAHAIMVAGGAGNLRRSVNTEWGKMCSVEDHDAGTDSIAAGVVAVLADDMTCIDITTALDQVEAGDLVGIQFTRIGGDGTDTVNADCYYLGIRVRYV